MTRRSSSTTSPPPSELAHELLEAPADAIPARLAGGLPRAAAVLEAMRTEASRHYHSDAKRAREIARRACLVAERLRDPVAFGWSRRIVAESCLFSGRMRQAEEAYALAARTWRAAGANALLGQLLVGRIHVLALLGRMREVEAAANEARRLLTDARDQTYLARLAMNLGNLRFQREEYAEALAEYDRASAAFARLRLRDETVIGLEVNRGVALTQLDRDADALGIFQRLERECGRREFDLLQAQIRMNGAYVHFLRADFEAALRSLGPAADYFRRTEHPAFLASCLLNRAEIYQELNLHAETMELAREAVSLFAAEGLRDDQALALSQEALARLALGTPALETLREARRLFRREKSVSRVALLDLLEGRARGLAGEAGPASGSRGRARGAGLALRARETFRRLGLIRWEAEATAVWLELSGRRVPAPRRARVLQGMLRRLPPRIYPLQTCRLLESLGSAQEEAGRKEIAARTLERAAAHLEGIRTRVPSEDSKISFLRDKTHLHDRILALELGRAAPRADRLFGWMERARAQSLWDRMRDPSVPPGDAGAAMAEERRRLSWLHARISRLELGDAEDRARAAGLRSELRGAEQRWSRLLRARAEGRGSRPGRAVSIAPDPASISAESLAAKLPRGWGFLSYHLAPGFSLALAVTRSGVRWRRLSDDLSERVAALADRLDFQWTAASMQAARRAAPPLAAGASMRSADGPSALAHAKEPAAPPAGGESRSPSSARFLLAATDSILRELHELLWRPLEEIGVPADLHWIVSPHGPVHRVPIPALRGPDGYLIERATICLTPSGRIWSRLRSRTAAANRRRAWIAGLPSATLPGVEREVSRVAARLGTWMAETDLSPTRDSLKCAGQTAGLIHLAAHGSFRRDNPSYSFVELADGPLYAHDLAEMRLPGSTVVLTACSSGRGAAPAGDEWIGLARGFLQAGASAVVASLWPIPDEPTFELMDRFYQGLAEGRGAPGALAAAMRAILPSYPHPWNWSAFTVLGGSASGV